MKRHRHTDTRAHRHTHRQRAMSGKMECKETSWADTALRCCELTVCIRVKGNVDGAARRELC